MSLRSEFYRKFLYRGYHALKRDGVNRALAELHASEWLSATELADLQRRKLEKLLDFAGRTVSYYRRIFGVTGLSARELALPENFRQLPVLTKEVIRWEGRELISSDLRGNRLGPNRTSGSTGEALYFFTDMRSLAYRKASVIRNHEWIGFHEGEPQVRLWSSPLDERRARRLYGRIHGAITNDQFLSAYELTTEKMDSYIEVMLRRQPRLLVSYPSVLEVFAQHCKERGAEFSSLRGIITSAETLFSGQRAMFEEVFRAPVFNRYGCREVADIAQECSAHDGLHVNAERILVEVVYEGERVAVKAGEIGGFLITDLDNYGMPLIRYQIGDSGSWHTEMECPCGRELPRLKEVEGRTMDVVRTARGKRLGGTYWTILFKVKPGIQQFQVLQNDVNGIQVRYVRGADFDDGVLDYFRHRIRRDCGNDFEVRFEAVEEIVPTTSGKRRLIISEIKMQ